MIYHYLITAFRNFRKNLLFTGINITGLAIGMAISVTALLYVLNEFSYDNFHENAGRIYRVILKMESASEGTTTSSVATAGISPSLQQDIPEVKAAVRVSTNSAGFFSHDEKVFSANHVLYADSALFTMFTFPMILGEKENALKEPYSVVLTRSQARKIFANEYEAPGQMISYNNKDQLLVTGIVEDPPINSLLQFDALISFTTLYQDPNMHLGWNGGHSYCNYILLQKGAKQEQAEERFPHILEKNINYLFEGTSNKWSLILQPLRQAHLGSSFDWDLETVGNINELIIIVSITLVVLIIACINFINLTTASSLMRMKEIGVRKVSGATRSQIIGQFISETFILSLVSLIFSLVIAEIAQIWIPNFINDPVIIEKLKIHNYSLFQLLGIMMVVLVFVSLVAGGYPAFYLSRFQAAKVLKGQLGISKNRPVFRNLLVVFQFFISAVLIICTLIIITQINILTKHDPGYDPENLIVIPLTSQSVMDDHELIQTRFKTIPGVINVGASSEVPGNNFTMNGYVPDGLDEPVMIHALDVDFNYINTLGIEIIKGRNFDKEFRTDGDAYLINETLAKQLNWDDPIGKKIFRGRKHEVIGVVSDFHYASLHNNIEPLLITLKPWQGYDYITVRTSGGNPEETLGILEKEWSAIAPYENFNYQLQENLIKSAYVDESGFARLLTFLAVLALIIAGMGLFGLAAYIIRQRSKEMAIRKVYGADLNQILVLISTGFLKWVLLANILAIPMAYYFMDKWLQNFVLHGGIKPWIFIIAILFSLLMASLIISFQVMKIGRIKPIRFIRYE